VTVTSKPLGIVTRRTCRSLFLKMRATTSGVAKGLTPASATRMKFTL
jgi:hypothetical protein